MTQVTIDTEKQEALRNALAALAAHRGAMTAICSFYKLTSEELIEGIHKLATGELTLERYAGSGSLQSLFKHAKLLKGRSGFPESFVRVVINAYLDGMTNEEVHRKYGVGRDFIRVQKQTELFKAIVYERAGSNVISMEAQRTSSAASLSLLDENARLRELLRKATELLSTKMKEV
ncbi:TPA: hypothetical protein ACVU44_001813 [Vibrio parahaemolyticus]|uniref:hypothetical protein n=1 Tax=Vibrio parahaemolyticus TaxID=670 RepID=UPI00177B6B1C|nr:hypothetical protein [Vibrio parahaemolyticus]MBD6966253.1 hypothetical protein [Vibrio parahaemolyticus]MBD6970088.1 hypothetical protein [Vibrio parahaemolyticus]